MQTLLHYTSAHQASIGPASILALGPIEGHFLVEELAHHDTVLVGPPAGRQRHQSKTYICSVSRQNVLGPVTHKALPFVLQPQELAADGACEGKRRRKRKFMVSIARSFRFGR